MKKRYLLVFLLLFSFNINKSSDIVYNSVQGETKYKYNLVEDIKYEETTEEINNPERGFYKPLFIRMSESGNVAANPTDYFIHLRVGIANFSKANNGVADKELSRDALDALDKTLKNIKNNGGSVVIRFAYDDFEGIANREPSLDMLIKHIEQIGEVLKANQEVVTYVELGFFGPWGQMHTSDICTQVNVKLALDKLLDILPESMTIGVRRPDYYAYFAGINQSEIDKNVSVKGDHAYRIGLFNNGYLGSESDLGTFDDREKEITWLEKQAKHTLYGGEVAGNYASGSALNTVEYLSKEAFRTHTSYLNLVWTNYVVDNWKYETYRETGSPYDGLSGFLYVSNHLGYRYVLKESYVDDEIYESGQIKVKFKVENVGFANMVNEKKVTLLLVKGGVVKEIETDIDVRDWNSKESKEVELKVNAPEDIVAGEYKIYLRISRYGDLKNDNNYQVVRMANENIWNEEYGANYMGKIEVLEGEKYTINYYLDNVKFDKFTTIVNGKENLKETYLKEIDNYKFIRVEVNGNQINYYYEGKVKNPNTVDKVVLYSILLGIGIIGFIVLKNIKIKRNLYK